MKRSRGPEECDEHISASLCKRKRKKKCSLHQDEGSSSTTTTTITEVKRTSPNNAHSTTATLKEKLHHKMTSKIDGARFRWINEQLYTVTGDQAKEMFDKDPSLFQVYHRGYDTQKSKWPMNPLNRVILYVKSLPKPYVIADFGCGDAKLATSVDHTVHSFDLVAANSNVIACNMADVPLSNASVDVCVFCLSLMGTNISDFIKEARRVLKKSGRLKICEIASRFSSVDNFTRDVEKLGFKLACRQSFSKLFLDFEFEAVSRKKSLLHTSIELKPCIYKRR